MRVKTFLVALLAMFVVVAPLPSLAGELEEMTFDELLFDRGISANNNMTAKFTFGVVVKVETSTLNTNPPLYRGMMFITPITAVTPKADGMIREKMIIAVDLIRSQPPWPKKGDIVNVVGRIRVKRRPCTFFFIEEINTETVGAINLPDYDWKKVDQSGRVCVGGALGMLAGATFALLAAPGTPTVP